MSETRPPITAGPIARAFRFLKRTSVNCGVADDGAGATDAESGGVVLAGAATGDDPAPAGDEAGGDSSCANERVIIKRAKVKASRVLINVKDKSWRFAIGGQVQRVPKNWVAALYEHRHIFQTAVIDRRYNLSIVNRL